MPGSESAWQPIGRSRDRSEDAGREPETAREAGGTVGETRVEAPVRPLDGFIP